MITRSKLVEQLRDYQIRSQNKCPPRQYFLTKPILSNWTDAAVSLLWALIFHLLRISSYITLHPEHYWISIILVFLAILLPIRLRIS